jgi:hypothetical protein
MPICAIVEKLPGRAGYAACLALWIAPGTHCAKFPNIQNDSGDGVH